MANLNAIARRKAINRRIRVIESLGGRCAHCGNADARVLQLDHVTGTENGKRAVLRGNKLCMALLAGRALLSDFQLLCANCHVIKTITNKDYLNHVKLEPREKISTKTVWKMRVWLNCKNCETAFMRRRDQVNAKYCGRLCQNRFQTKDNSIRKPWLNSFIPGVYSTKAMNVRTMPLFTPTS